MESGQGQARSRIDPDVALRSISRDTACATGERFFESLVENLARTLGTHGAWVTEYLPERRRLRALAFWLGGELVADYEYDIAGTPCEPVVQKACLVNFPENVVTLFPGDPDLKRFGAVGYMGVPLQDVDGRILGNLAAVDTRPLHDDPGLLAVFEIFASRAAAKLRRLRAEADVRERERKLDRLLAGAMDAIVELDSSLRVTLMNRSSCSASCRRGSSNPWEARGPARWTFA